MPTLAEYAAREFEPVNTSKNKPLKSTTEETLSTNSANPLGLNTKTASAQDKHHIQSIRCEITDRVSGYSCKEDTILSNPGLWRKVGAATTNPTAEKDDDAPQKMIKEDLCGSSDCRRCALVKIINSLAATIDKQYPPRPSPNL